MSYLPILPVLLPLVAGALMLLTPRQQLKIERRIALAANLVLLLVAILLLLRVAGGEVLVYSSGNWPAPYGIVARVDDRDASVLGIDAPGSVPVHCLGKYLGSPQALADYVCCNIYFIPGAEYFA